MIFGLGHAASRPRALTMRSRAGSLLALDVCPDGTEYIVCGESTYLETFAITSKESKAQYGMGTMQVRLAPPPRGNPVLQQYSSFPAAFRADVASTCCLPDWIVA